MSESTETARTATPPREAGLPWQIRGARLAELMFLPVGVFSLATIPLDEIGTLAKVGAQVAAAVAAFLGLKRRRRWAWLLAMALAAFLVAGMVLRAPGLARASLDDRGTLVAITMVGWAFLTQLAVLLCCATLIPGGRWRTELR